MDTCKQCKWWDTSEEYTIEDHKKLHRCKKYAPVVDSKLNGPHAVWPLTVEDTVRCGDFKKK